MAKVKVRVEEKGWLVPYKEATISDDDGNYERARGNTREDAIENATEKWTSNKLSK